MLTNLPAWVQPPAQQVERCARRLTQLVADPDGGDYFVPHLEALQWALGSRDRAPVTDAPPGPDLASAKAEEIVASSTGLGVTPPATDGRRVLHRDRKRAQGAAAALGWLTGTLSRPPVRL